MAFFDSFTTSLKQKWLQFYQVNRSWITLHMQVESVYTPDGGRRPPSYLILGVANALEPKLAQLMLPFSRLNADADTLIEVLELNFDPELALGNEFNPEVVEQLIDDEPPMSGISAPEDDTAADVMVGVEVDAFSGMSLDETSRSMMDDSDDEPMIVLGDRPELDAFSGMSLDETSSSMMDDSDDEPIIVLDDRPELDAFEGISLDEMSSGSMMDDSDDEPMIVLDDSQPDAFGDLSLDETPDDSFVVMRAVQPDELSAMSLDEMADAVLMVDTDDDSAVVLTPVEPDELSAMSLDEMAEELVLIDTNDDSVMSLGSSELEADAFGDLSFDESDEATPELTLDDETIVVLSAADADVLGDIWEEGTKSQSGDEMQSEDDSEISRLFPNF